MDFTYYIAAFLALIIGFIGSIIFVATKGRSKRRLIAFALVASLAVNFFVLINWSQIGSVTAEFLLLDFGFIIAFTCVGCVIGVLPILGLRKLWRMQSQR